MDEYKECQPATVTRKTTLMVKTALRTKLCGWRELGPLTLTNQEMKEEFVDKDKNMFVEPSAKSIPKGQQAFSETFYLLCVVSRSTLYHFLS